MKRTYAPMAVALVVASVWALSGVLWPVGVLLGARAKYMKERSKR